MNAMRVGIGFVVGLLAGAVLVAALAAVREQKLCRALEEQRGVALPLLELPPNTVVTTRSTEGAGTSEGYVHVVAIEGGGENAIRSVLWPERELPKQFWVITPPGNRYPQMREYFPSPDRNMKPTWPPAPTPAQR